MSTRRTRSGNSDQKQHGHSQQPTVEGSACTAQQPTISDMPSKHLKGGEASTKASVAAVSGHFSQHPVNVANTSLGVGLPEDSALPAPPSAGRRKSKSNTPLPGQAAGDAHGKRKCTGSNSVGADAVSQAKSKKGKKPAAEDLSPVGAANPPSKRAQAKNLSASTGGRPSKKKGAASKPASGLTRTHREVSEQVRESEIVPPKALTPQVRKRDGAPKTNANTSQVVARNTRSAARSTQKTALPENESQVEADEDWEARLRHSDEDQHPNSPSASEFEDLSVSGDDLNLEGDGQQLATTLEAERAMWNDGSELVATALKGKGKAPEPRPTCGAPIAGKAYQLQLDGFESSSESELEPDRPGRGDRQLLETPIWAQDSSPAPGPSRAGGIRTDHALPTIPQADVATRSTSVIALPALPARQHGPTVSNMNVNNLQLAAPRMLQPAAIPAPEVPAPVPATPPGPLTGNGLGQDTTVVNALENTQDLAPPQDATPQPTPEPPVDHNLLPSAHYTIVTAAPGAPVLLNPQHLHIRAIIHATIPRLEVFLLTEHAFPDHFTTSQFIRMALIEAAQTFKYLGLGRRLNDDQEFINPLVVLTKQRISSFRSVVKKSHYPLATSPDTTALVNGLFEWLTYIYPYTEQASTTNGKRTVPWNKPYLNDCVVAVLRAAFFTGPHSIVNAAPAIFASTLPQRQDECEVPMVMVALVGTTIHAVLSDWNSGLNKSQRFSTDAYLDVYNEHIVLLKGIKSENARGYHIMMHRLFTCARCDTVMPFLHLPHTNTALAHVDFAAMDVD
ncbi:hypothetical protein BD310DRAFT_952753 [Dichomitus squalens]|uniref:DUF6532 domain-containing protein n=1 Tax=Dichomitus squalens TaxID=114155 RepID=A0A4Q9PGK3_9APHY|nr:hypothetical protein BD310DRAFT_952753 [Dichomitus squalens]